MLDIPIKQLEKCFNILNKKFYNNALQNTAISIQSQGKRKEQYGWITEKQVWTSNETGEIFYEINICAECLHFEIEVVASILLHEMAHLYNLQKDINDTSKNKLYHNKSFKFTAEEHGLEIEHNKKYGWSETIPTEKALAFIEERLKDINFVYCRSIPTEAEKQAMEKEKKKQKDKGYHKYICQSCGIVARAKKDIGLICEACNVKLIIADTKKKD